MKFICSKCGEMFSPTFNGTLVGGDFYVHHTDHSDKSLMVVEYHGSCPFCNSFIHYVAEYSLRSQHTANWGHGPTLDVITDGVNQLETLYNNKKGDRKQ